MRFVETVMVHIFAVARLGLNWFQELEIPVEVGRIIFPLYYFECVFNT